MAHIPFDEDEVGDAVEDRDDEPSSKVRTLPESSFSCAQSCLILAIAISIIIFAVSCFGLWAILDYVMVEVLGWQYRQPISELLPHLSTLVAQISMLLMLS
ncbi:MAG TPA: hypothetical protein VE553_10430 [Candidatus Binatia bacterium]|nr:hypothetical protein [Candidatus Binatia bacterium]